MAGKYYETLFKSECMKRGIIVLQPECSHLPFDVVVLSANIFLRIQVKGTDYLSTHRKNKGGGIDKKYRVSMRNNKGHYSEQGIDIMAAYVVPLKNWYILPVALCSARDFSIRPNSITGLAGECRGRWDLLGAREDSK